MKKGDYRKHIKTGKVYRIIEIANQKATKPGWDVVVVYVDGDCNVWAREITKFERRTVKWNI